MPFKEARLKAGLSVAEVQKALGVSDAAVYQWETGVTVPQTRRLLELAKLYNCGLDELLDGAEVVHS